VSKNFVLVLLLYIFAVFFYLKDINVLLDSDNVLTSFDGYYYANLAKRLINGEYASIDYLCNVPDYCNNPYPPPMHSYIAYILKKILNIDLKYSILFFSPILAPLLIFSMYLYTNKFLPFYAFIGGAILAALNPVFFARNVPGRFDTDSLILFFIFLLLFFTIKIVESIKDLKSSLVCLFLFLISFYLFMWWYQKSLFAFTFLLSLLMGYTAFYYRSLINHLKNFLFIVLFYVISTNFYLYNGVFETIDKIKGYFFKEPSSFIPESIAEYIMELQPASLKLLISNTTDNIFLFILSVSGLLIIFYKHFKYIVVSSPIILIGLLSFKSGFRFLMYLIPFLGLGLGYVLYLFYKYLEINYFHFLKKNYYKVILILLIVAASFPTSLAPIKPKKTISDEEYNLLKSAKNILTENSYIWTAWSYGNIFEYLLEKGTYIDNHNFNIIKNYAIANSLYTDSYERSYKLISFITNKFYFQYDKLSFEEFNKKVDNYNIPPKNDVYLIFYKSLAFEVQTTRMGVYNTKIKNFEIPMVKNISKCKRIDDYVWDCRDFIFNSKEHILIWNTSNFIFGISRNVIGSYYVDRDQNSMFKLNSTLYNGSGKNLILEIEKIEDNLYFSYIIEPFFDTVYNRLYFLNESNAYFEKVYDKFPYFVIYKVKNHR